MYQGSFLWYELLALNLTVCEVIFIRLDWFTMQWPFILQLVMFSNVNKLNILQALTLKETERHIVNLERKLRELIEERGIHIIIEMNNICEKIFIV